MLSNNISFRRAVSSDYGEIHKIISLNHVSIEKNENKGFLCHYPRIDDLNYRLKDGKYNLVALENNICIGFITAFSNFEATDYIKNGLLEYEIKAFSKIKDNKYIWLDQLAIYPPYYYRNRIGTSLIKKTIELAQIEGYCNFYGTVSLYPETNIASIEFLKANGFSFDETVIMNSRKWVFIKLNL